MQYVRVAKRVFYPLPKELQDMRLDTFIQRFANPLTMNTGRAYARASAEIVVAHLEDYWEANISSDPNEFPEFDVRKIHNGAAVIYYDKSIHDHRDIVSFTAYPVEKDENDSMLKYRGYKIFQNADGWHLWDDYRAVRCDTAEQMFAKIDLALENSAEKGK